MSLRPTRFRSTACWTDIFSDQRRRAGQDRNSDGATRQQRADFSYRALVKLASDVLEARGSASDSLRHACDAEVNLGRRTVPSMCFATAENRRPKRPRALNAGPGLGASVGRAKLFSIAGSGALVARDGCSLREEWP